MEIAKGLGRLFYFINPKDTFVKTVEDLPQPDYFAQVRIFCIFHSYVIITEFWRFYVPFSLTATTDELCRPSPTSQLE